MFDDKDATIAEKYALKDKKSSENISRFIEDSMNTKDRKITKSLGVVSTDQASRILQSTGIDVSGYERILDNYGIRHAMSEHGDEKREASRGQVAITQRDIKLIPDIVENPDAIELLGRNGAGREIIRFSKRSNGTVYYVEEVRTGKKQLVPQMMYKRSATPDASGATRPPAQTPEAFREPNDNDTIAPQKINPPGESYSLRDKDRDLVAVHNLSEANLAHADRMGGLPVPSLAITKNTHLPNGFGEVTLVASKDMIDPKLGAKTYGSDIYSPRYPTISHKVDTKALDRAWKKLGKESSELGNVLLSELDESDISRKGLEAFDTSRAAKLAFLREIGRDIELPREESKSNFMTAAPELRSILKDVPYFTTRLFDNPAFMKAFNRVVDHEVNTSPPDIADDVRDAFYTHDGKPAPSIITQMIKEAKIGNTKPVDVYAARRAIDDATKSVMDQYHEWVQRNFSEIITGERLYLGYNDNGRQIYKPHNLENVVKIMKKELRGGEGFNYGVGSIRAKLTPQFRSVAQIKNEQNRLITKSDFEKVKSDIDNEFVGLASRFKAPIDSFANNLIEIAERRSVAPVLREYYKKVSDDDIKAVGDFMIKLRDLPTEYFESKQLRSVGLNEFKGAIVPKDAAQKTLDILRRNGIDHIETYDRNDPVTRQTALEHFDSEMFALRDAADKLKGIAKAAANSQPVKELRDTAWWKGIAKASDRFFSDLQMQITPMAVTGERGSDRARAIAKTFANEIALVQHRFGQIDTIIRNCFDPKTRAAMGTALDNESAHEKLLREDLNLNPAVGGIGSANISAFFNRR